MTKNQQDAISKYLADISKLVFGATVLRFIVPISAQPLPMAVFWGGLGITIVTLW